jgi:hypothetical protein
LAGKGHLTTHCNIPIQKQSTYLSLFKGIAPQRGRKEGSILEFDMTVGDQLKTHSNFIGALSPDHTTYPGWKKGDMSPGPAQKDIALRTLISKRFMPTASTPMRHTFTGDFGI